MRDLVDSHAALKRKVRALETRAEYYWKGSALGNDSPWVLLTPADQWANYSVAGGAPQPMGRIRADKTILRGGFVATSNNPPALMGWLPTYMAPMVETFFVASYPPPSTNWTNYGQFPLVYSVSPDAGVRLINPRGTIYANSQVGFSHCDYPPAASFQ